MEAMTNAHTHVAFARLTKLRERAAVNKEEWRALGLTSVFPSYRTPIELQAECFCSDASIIRCRFMGRIHGLWSDCMIAANELMECTSG